MKNNDTILQPPTAISISKAPLDNKKTERRLLGLMQLPAIDALDRFSLPHGVSSARATFVIDPDINTVNVNVTATADNDPTAGVIDQAGEQATKVKLYGKTLSWLLDRSRERLPRLRAIADDCAHGRIDTTAQLRLRLERRISAYYYVAILLLLAACLAILRLFSR